jgi:hypothetical protein
VKAARNMMYKGYDVIMLVGIGLAIPKTEHIANILREEA